MRAGGSRCARRAGEFFDSLVRPIPELLSSREITSEAEDEGFRGSALAGEIYLNLDVPTVRVELWKKIQRTVAQCFLA